MTPMKRRPFLTDDTRSQSLDLQLKLFLEHITLLLWLVTEAANSFIHGSPVCSPRTVGLSSLGGICLLWCHLSLSRIASGPSWCPQSRESEDGLRESSCHGLRCCPWLFAVNQKRTWVKGVKLFISKDSESYRQRGVPKGFNHIHRQLWQAMHPDNRVKIFA